MVEEAVPCRQSVSRVECTHGTFADTSFVIGDDQRHRLASLYIPTREAKEHNGGMVHYRDITDASMYRREASSLHLPGSGKRCNDYNNFPPPSSSSSSPLGALFVFVVSPPVYPSALRVPAGYPSTLSGWMPTGCFRLRRSFIELRASIRLMLGAQVFSRRLEILPHLRTCC